MLETAESGKQVWKDNMFKAADYLTLVRNQILVKMAYNLSITTEIMLSKCGNYFFILCRSDEEDAQN